MKIVQISRLCSKAMFNLIMKDDSVKGNQSIQKFHRVLVEGIAQNGIPIVVYSERPINKNNCNKKYIPSSEEVVNGVFYHYSRAFNISVISALYAMMSSFFWVLFNVSKDDAVILDTYALALAVGTVLACKIKKIPCIALVTDVPTKSIFYVDNDKISTKSKFNDWLISKTDAMILITKQMADIVNKKGKPFIVMEGFGDVKMAETENKLENKYSKRTVMYTGMLTKAYGIDMLIDGFCLANIPNSQLILYGAGPYADVVQEKARANSNIIYGGTRPNDEIVKEQMKATLLVNPRYTNNDFTAYSFPGKNLEYMASGTPTLTTNLPGMPEEYKDHLFILEKETVDGLSDKLQELFSQTDVELHNVGLKAKQWMLEEKNSVAQTARIIRFIETNFRR